jgi:hypothetical protein
MPFETSNWHWSAAAIPELYRQLCQIELFSLGVGHSFLVRTCFGTGQKAVWLQRWSAIGVYFATVITPRSSAPPRTCAVPSKFSRSTHYPRSLSELLVTGLTILDHLI